jgi:hypothetical protein
MDHRLYRRRPTRPQAYCCSMSYDEALAIVSEAFNRGQDGWKLIDAWISPPFPSAKELLKSQKGGPGPCRRAEGDDRKDAADQESCPQHPEQSQHDGAL